VTLMGKMFEGATAFDQDLSNWEVGNVEDMSDMFLDASRFDQNLGEWDISGITPTGMFGMLSGSGLSVDNYDATLTGWAAQDVRSGITLEADGLYYCAALI